MNLVPFVSEKIADPWSEQDEIKYANYGFESCSFRYIPAIHAKLRLIDENLILCSVKLHNKYKNFHLLPETRKSFYYLAYCPQITLVHKLKEAKIEIGNLPSNSIFYNLLLHYDEYVRDGYDFQSGVSIIEEHILIKVDAPIGDFYDRLNIGILNNEIVDKYTELNTWYSVIITEYFSILNDEYIKKEFAKKNIVNCVKKIGIHLLVSGLIGITINEIGDWINIHDMYMDTDCDNVDLTCLDASGLEEFSHNSFSGDENLGAHQISFGQNYHVKQVGGGIKQADVDITKVAGTSNTYNVTYQHKIIATIKSILPGTKFYVPGIGTCKIV